MTRDLSKRAFGKKKAGSARTQPGEVEMKDQALARTPTANP